jgi:hypothetical protein
LIFVSNKKIKKMNTTIKNFGMLILTAGLLTTTACKKETGCTDPNARNYNPDAVEDDNSCETVPYTITTTDINGVSYERVSGTFDENYTFTSSKKWLLSGGIFVDANATLTIQAGTEIYAADDQTTPFLSILRGGKINAVGTATSPIVMTTIKSVTGTPAAGDWGGIIINGNAQINNGTEAEGEGGTGKYGGSNDNDNSGTIKYVRVEYAGKLLGTDNELNGFSFNGVGSGTTVEYIQAYRGADDGIEFFGGTVSVKYAVSTGNKDDSFDWTYGWRGNGQFWVVNQEVGGGDRGIEADNNGNDNTLSPYSNPTIANVTLIGIDDGDASNTGMRLREGTKGTLHNAIVTGFPSSGVRVSDAQTTTNMTNGELALKNSNVFTNGTNFRDCATFSGDMTNSTTILTLTGYVGTSTTNAADPTTLGSWFSPGTFVGAVESTNDWTAGWTK